MLGQQMLMDAGHAAHAPALLPGKPEVKRPDSVRSIFSLINEAVEVLNE